MDSLLSSTIWPLGSVFLSLFNARHTTCTSLPAIQSNPLPPSTKHAEFDLDGSPISHQIPLDPVGCESEDSGSEQDHSLEHLLTKPSDPTPHKKPSLSDRLTSPSSASGYYHHSSRSKLPHHAASTTKNSERWVQSFHKTSPKMNVYNAPDDPHSNLANRFDPAPQTFITSSNRIECNTRSWRNWGPTNRQPARPDYHHHKFDRQDDSSWSNKRSRAADHSGYGSTSPTKTNSEVQNTESKELDRWDQPHEFKLPDDQKRKKRKYKLNPIDWDWSHWTNAAQAMEALAAAKLASPSLSESANNRSPSVGASVSAVDWKKKGIEVGLSKVKGPKPSHPTPNTVHSHSGHHHHSKKRKMSPGFDHRDRHMNRRTTRSISPAFSSSQAGSSSSRLPMESQRDYLKLQPLHPALKDSIKRAVFSWINQVLVKSFWKIGIWFEDSKKWKSDQWGGIRVDQLEQIVDLEYSKGLGFILRACKTDRFIDLTIKPIHSGIFFLTKDAQSNADYLRLTKDFTPIGLLYRPIIKTLRKLSAGTGMNRIQIEKFIRHHLLKTTEEEDLIYLFQSDDDPYGCIRRAARDGIIEIYDDEHFPPSSSSSRTVFLDHPPPSHANHKRKRIPFEDKYIGLKPHWVSNKDTADPPSVYSPTISQGESSAALPGEEERSKMQEGKPSKSDVNASCNGRKEESVSCSKNSSTNTDDLDRVGTSYSRKTSPELTHPHQHSISEKSQPNNLGSHLSTASDDAIIDALIIQLRKDVSPSY